MYTVLYMHVYLSLSPMHDSLTLTAEVVWLTLLHFWSRQNSVLDTAERAKFANRQHAQQWMCIPVVERDVLHTMDVHTSG